MSYLITVINCFIYKFVDSESIRKIETINNFFNQSPLNIAKYYKKYHKNDTIFVRMELNRRPSINSYRYQ